jgi:hypothetical protein
MLNFYLWGGYLGWNNNNLRVFVDSRVDIFEYAGVLRDYLDLLGLKNVDTVLDKYRIQYILFPKSEPVVSLLSKDSAWTVVYSDDLCVLLQRTSAKPAMKSAEGISSGSEAGPSDVGTSQIR